MTDPKVGVQMNVWRYKDGLSTYYVLNKIDVPSHLRSAAEEVSIIPTEVQGHRIINFKTTN